MAGSIQRAVKLDERKGYENLGICPVVLSDKQQKGDPGFSSNAQRKAALQAEAMQRLARRRVSEGRGGGFNDRQDASERNQHDSDDEEFDEFGRRKKRRKNAPVKKKEAPEPQQAASSSCAPVPQSSRQESTDGERVEGTVRWYESTKGFGFVRTPGVDADIYFKDQDRTLAPVEGMRVSFLLRITPDGKPQARQIMRGSLTAGAGVGAGALPRATQNAEDEALSDQLTSEQQMQQTSEQLAAQIQEQLLSRSETPSTHEAMQMMQAQMLMRMQMMAKATDEDAVAQDSMLNWNPS